jgi:predicted ATPase
LGHIDRALALAEQAVNDARRIDHPLTLGFALLYSGIIQQACRNRETVQRMAIEAIALSERHGFQLFLAGGKVLQAWARAPEGNAIDAILSSTATTAETGNQSFAPQILGVVAEVQEAVGHCTDALATVEMGLALSAQYAMTFWDAELRRQKGELFLKIAGHTPAEAERLFDDALQIARRQGAKTLELRSTMSLAHLWQQQGKPQAAHSILAPIYAQFTEGFDTPDLHDAKALLDELGGLKQSGKT